jgi:glutaminyl-peptide cyclotransferase
MIMKTISQYGLYLAIICLCFFVFYACVEDKPIPPVPVIPPVKAVVQVPVPAFQADSAYAFVKKQVAFGPRVPSTKGHKACSAWLVSEFKRFGCEVIEQKFTAKGYQGDVYESVNIIAQYKPAEKRRLLFAAHWDSRFIADKDTKDQQKPIDGADDGGSGVAVLLEMARVLQAHPLDVGVDFVLFDAEDQGKDGSKEDTADHSRTWCLGSQHWAKNLHSPNYAPYSAILLDMVGAAGATFRKEGISTQVAPMLVNQVWGLAATMGFGNFFVNETMPGLTDDHFFVVTDAKIPMIDIINTKGTGEDTFGPHHHTHGDNMTVIDKATLKAVGQVMIAYIYRTHNGNL